MAALADDQPSLQDYSHTAVLDLLSVPPESLASVELRALVAALSGRGPPAPTIGRDELLAQLRELRASADGGHGVAMAALSDEHFIDPGSFPGVDWSRPLFQGSGSYGKVMFSEYRGRPVALKVFKELHPYEPVAKQLDHWREIRKEIAILQQAARGHENLCQIVGVTCHPRTEAPILVMWRLKADLAAYLPSCALTVAQRLRLVHGLALGLLWLHDRPSPILHLDLKMANIMLDYNNQAVLCDFGLSHIMADGVKIRAPDRSCRLARGNLSHRAPEMFAERAFLSSQSSQSSSSQSTSSQSSQSTSSQSCQSTSSQSTSSDTRIVGTEADVYGFAVCAWEILTGVEWGSQLIPVELRRLNLMPRGRDLASAFTAAVLQHNFRPPLPGDWPDELRQLLTSAWHDDAAQRPTMRALVEAFRQGAGGAVAAAFERSAAESQRQHVLHMFELRFAGDAVALAIAGEVFAESPAVPLSSFVRVFHSRTMASCLRDSNVPPSTAYALLQLALGVPLDAQGDAKTVHFDSYAKMVDAFGPLRAGFFQRVREVVESPLGQLHWSSDKAAKKLRGQPAGAHILRYSEKPGAALALTRLLHPDTNNHNDDDDDEGSGQPIIASCRIYRTSDDDDDDEAAPQYWVSHPLVAHLRFASYSAMAASAELKKQLRLGQQGVANWMSPLARASSPAPAQAMHGPPPPRRDYPAWNAFTPPQPRWYHFESSPGTEPTPNIQSPARSTSDDQNQSD